MQVRDAMTTTVMEIDPEMSVAVAARRMKQLDAGILVVAQAGRVVGVLTDRDIVVRVIAEGRDPNTTIVSAVATSHVASVSPDDHIDDALAVMTRNAIRRVPVMDGRQLVGILSVGDVATDAESGHVLDAISNAPPNR